ncbi:unnamed protein product [Angiostrongylus costaricensis]|uniref:DUF4206 domain-containing protein n=1 Tax=Angiostrongylus costaricensis TaxID=334426 RepID=A0A158PM06_ANGCS|nr:unnamed protein product [Angiostrongylus costaricensis]
MNEFRVQYRSDDLPEVVPQEPYWKKVQEDLLTLLKRDSSISMDLEESNILMYALELSLCVIEESRWLNEISKDPELSRLVHEIDLKFPLAMNSSTLANSVPASVDELENRSAGQPDVPCFDLADAVNTKPTFFFNKKRAARRSLIAKGADADRSSRSPEHVWKKTILPILESFVEAEPLRDPRVAHWIEDMVQNHDKLMLFQGTSHDSSVGNFDGNLTRLSTNSECGPLRESWIFTLWKPESVKVLLEAQNYRCSGCGIRILRLLRQSFLSMLSPGCEIYNSSKNTTHMEFQVEKVRVLKHVIMLREKLSYMWDFVKECPDAEEAVTKYGNLRTLFTSLEHHLLHSLDLFSLSDLIRVHNKDMTSLLEPIVYYARCHIEACEVRVVHTTSPKSIDKSGHLVEAEVRYKEANIEEMKPERSVSIAELFFVNKQIDLSTSMESLAMAQLKPRPRRRSHREGYGWQRCRWMLYVTIWVAAIFSGFVRINGFLDTRIINLM